MALLCVDEQGTGGRVGGKEKGRLRWYQVMWHGSRRQFLSKEYKTFKEAKGERGLKPHGFLLGD